jgi:hypothetical protein
MWCFYILTSNCASRHNDAHSFDVSTSKSRPSIMHLIYFDFEMCFVPQRRTYFFDISISKNSPNMVCFIYFNFEMCFVPQRRTLFRHLNFKKNPDLVCFIHYNLEMCFAPQRRIFSLSSGQFSEPILTPRSHKLLEKYNLSRFSYLFTHLDFLSSKAFSFVICLFFSSFFYFSAPPLLFIFKSLTPKPFHPKIFFYPKIL